MSVTVRQLALLVQGQVVGDPDLAIQASRSLGEAGPGDITFLENEKRNPLHLCQASAVVVAQPLPAEGKTLLVVADPFAAFIRIYQHMHGRPEPAVHGVDPQAVVHAARLGPDASIYPFVSVGAGTVIGARCRLYPGVRIGRFCRLGDDVTIYPNAVLYDATVVGHRAIIHANAVLGADGFGFRLQKGRHVKVPQQGHVEIGDDVEIGAGTTIDRGTFQATRVGDGTKIDNLVQIGHNCRIGRHNLFAGQVGIGGSCSTGDYVVLAGQVGVADHVCIGDQVAVGGGSGVINDVPAGQTLFGTPARSAIEQKRNLVSLGKLPEMRRDLQRIKQRLGLDDERDAQSA